MVDRSKAFGGNKFLRFHGIKFISRRLGQRISTKMGHHVFENKYQLGFEDFVKVETNLGPTMFRYFLVLYRGIDFGRTELNTTSEFL